MNLVRDPIPGTIVKIAVPYALGMIFNTLFNVTDAFFAGRLSTDALAALSLSFPMYFLVLGPGIGIQAGAGALISNALGSGDEARAVRYQAQANTLGVIVGMGLTAVLYLLLPSMFRLFGADGDVLAGGLRYMRVIAGGAVFIILSQTLNSGLMARGDTKAFRNVLIAMAILNVGLDPLFMFGVEIAGVQVIPAMGEAGTALATVLLQGVGATTYLLVRSQSRGCSRGASLRDYLPDREILREVIGQSAPATLDFLVMTLGTFVINYFIADFGRNAIAAYGAAIRIEQIALLPLMGISTAVATLVGQNNGAGRIDRVRETFRTAIRISIVAAVAILTPVILAAAPILRQFTETTEVVAIGRRYLYVQAITYFSYILMNLSNSMLRGIKKPMMILWVGAFRQVAAPLLVFPLLAYTFGLQVDGVFWGLVIVNWSAAIFTYFWSRSRLSAASDESSDDDTKAHESGMVPERTSAARQGPADSKAQGPANATAPT